MSKKLIIGISIATVIIAAAVLAVVLIRSRSLTDETPLDGGATSTEDGTGSGSGLGSSSGGQQPGKPGGSGTPTPPQGGPCGDGVCSEGESWCTPDCGDAQQRFLGSIKATVAGTTITISWKTDQASTGEVSYGKTAQYELGTLPSSTSSTTHEIKLTGLSPGTAYHVKVHAVQGDQTYDSGELIYEL